MVRMDGGVASCQLCCIELTPLLYHQFVYVHVYIYVCCD